MTDAEVFFATDFVLRRGMLNQALVPVLDFTGIASADAVNVAIRFNRRGNALELFAKSELAPGTIVTLQRYLGRLDSMMRTGVAYGGLLLEAVTGKFGADDDAGRKMCHERAGELSFYADGTPTSALIECVALLAAKSPKQRAFIAASPRKALLADAELRRSVGGNLSAVTRSTIDRLVAGASSAPECVPFEPLRLEMISTFEKAVAILDRM